MVEMTSTVLHEEKAPFSFTIKASLYLFLFFLLVFTIRTWMDPSEPRWAFWVLLIVTVVMVLVFWSFFNMRYRITDVGVEASMSPFSHSVKFEDIEDVYLDKVPFWMGWGLRMWWRRIGFISMHKVAVVVRKKRGFFRNFWLSTEDSEKFSKMIEERMKDRK